MEDVHNIFTLKGFPYEHSKSRWKPFKVKILCRNLVISDISLRFLPLIPRFPHNIFTLNGFHLDLECINGIADYLTLKAENPSATSLGAGSPDNSMKVLPP